MTDTATRIRQAVAEAVRGAIGGRKLTANESAAASVVAVATVMAAEIAEVERRLAAAERAVEQGIVRVAEAAVAESSAKASRAYSEAMDAHTAALRAYDEGAAR